MTKQTNLVALDTATIITNVANVFVSVNKSKDTINTLIKPLQLAKITMNTLKQNCALSLRFMAVLDDAKVAPLTAKNYLAEIRSAVNNGTKFSFNAAQDRARAKAKATKTTAPASAAPSADIEPLPVNPAGTPATPPKRLISMPSDAIDAIVVALSNVRATCTQDTWLHVLTLNPALAQFLDRANGVWKTPAPAPAANPATLLDRIDAHLNAVGVVAEPAPVATKAKRVRAPKK
jgi:hypothetical protein